MRRLELGRTLFFLHLALEWLLRVLDVLRETAQSLVVADSRRVRRLERLVMLHERCALLGRRAVRDWDVLTDDLPRRVEHGGALDLLREGLLLLERLASKAFLVREELGPVKVVFHVRNHAREGRALADSAFLDWIGQDVPGPDDDSSVVCRVPIVLDDLLVVFHVGICRVRRLSDMLRRPESFLVANFDLASSVFSSNECAGGLLEWIADARVGHPTEQNVIGLAFLQNSNVHVARIGQDLLDSFAVRVQTS